MDAQKANAIDLGETAGEKTAEALFEARGIAALAATLENGAETWEKDARAADLAAKASVHEDWRYAFYATFARGARRTAFAVVQGEKDGLEGKAFGDGLKALSGCRDSVKLSYERAYLIGADKRAVDAKASEVEHVTIGVPAIVTKTTPV